MASEKHKAAARRNGRLYGGKKNRSETELFRDFLNSIDCNGPMHPTEPELGPCWIWTKSKNIYGYGNFCVRGKPSKAHRYAYEIYHGLFDPKKYVCHSCDNPPCCNPSHLFIGDAKANNHDAMLKGRSWFFKGSKLRHRINEEQIGQIRKLFVPNKMTPRMISEKLGIGFHTVRWAIYGSYKKKAPVLKRLLAVRAGIESES